MSYKIKIKNKKKYYFLFLIFLLVFLNFPILNITVVRGSSMNPTLYEGDKLVLSKFKDNLDIRNYKRGDLIIFTSPDDKSKLLIKRIIGLPGDSINIENGYVKVNNVYINEPYIDKNVYTQSLKKGEYYIVPDNRIFVIGDNRFPKRSNDSRFFGSIPLSSVKGRAVLRIYPLDKIKKF